MTLWKKRSNRSTPSPLVQTDLFRVLPVCALEATASALPLPSPSLPPSPASKARAHTQKIRKKEEGQLPRESFGHVLCMCLYVFVQ